MYKDIKRNLYNAIQAMRTACIYAPSEQRKEIEEGYDALRFALADYVIEDIGHYDVIEALKDRLGKAKRELEALKSANQQ